MVRGDAATRRAERSAAVTWWTKGTTWRLPAEYRGTSQAGVDFNWQVQVRTRREGMRTAVAPCQPSQTHERSFSPGAVKLKHPVQVQIPLVPIGVEHLHGRQPSLPGQSRTARLHRSLRNNAARPPRPQANR